MRLSEKSSPPPLRLDLRVSPQLRVTLAGLAVAAALSIVVSGLPAWLLFGVPLLWWQADRSLRANGEAALLFRADGTATRLLAHGNESAIEPRAVHERGPLAVLVFGDGAYTVRHACAPDTLDAAQRRRLRLWFAHRQPLARGPLHV